MSKITKKDTTILFNTLNNLFLKHELSKFGTTTQNRIKINDIDVRVKSFSLGSDDIRTIDFSDGTELKIYMMDET